MPEARQIGGCHGAAATSPDRGTTDATVLSDRGADDAATLDRGTRHDRGNRHCRASRSGSCRMHPSGLPLSMVPPSSAPLGLPHCTFSGNRRSSHTPGWAPLLVHQGGTTKTEPYQPGGDFIDVRDLVQLNRMSLLARAYLSYWKHMTRNI
jgi:hypothetical protein